MAVLFAHPVRSRCIDQFRLQNSLVLRLSQREYSSSSLQPTLGVTQSAYLLAACSEVRFEVI